MDQWVQQASDFIWLLLSGILSYWFRHGDINISTTYLFAILGIALFNHNIFSYMGIYRIHLPCCLLHKTLQSIMVGWGLSMLMLITMLFFSHQAEEVSRIWVLAWMVLGLMGLMLLRGLLTYLLVRWSQVGSLGERVVIIGAGDIGQWLLKQLEYKSHGHIHVVGVFDDRLNRLKLQDSAVEVRGTTDDLMVFVREYAIDMIVIALPSQAEYRLNQLVMKLRVLPVEIHVCPGRIGFNLERSEVVEMGGVPLLKVVSRPLETWGVAVKRLEDLLIASMILILISPLLLLIALAIRLDSPGPVFFVQLRGGFNGRVFWMLKFRSMRLPSPGPKGKLEQARPGDPRVTRVGRFLRQTSLDELPQFFNVIKGDMSIVGPRPHAIEHDQEFSQIINHYVSRLRVKPGITGWAQINGFRGLTDTREKLMSRLDYDLYYIDNWSLWFDFSIIVKTVVFGMINRNAY
ncbi:putative colanic acid biosysnthesis UDP-glucose lipid carrier transferase [Gammaproteobacteria bacterium]